MKIRDECLFLAMIALLVLNDHILKGAFPGLITGKLSDLAGPFVVYRLLRGLGKWGLHHAWAASISLVFAIAVKTSQPLADLASRSSCGWIFAHCGFIADPWDLLAFVPFAIWAGIRMLSRSAAFLEISPGR